MQLTRQGKKREKAAESSSLRKQVQSPLFAPASKYKMHRFSVSPKIIQSCLQMQMIYSSSATVQQHFTSCWSFPTAPSTQGSTSVSSRSALCCVCEVVGGCIRVTEGIPSLIASDWHSTLSLFAPSLQRCKNDKTKTGFTSTDVGDVNGT